MSNVGYALLLYHPSTKHLLKAQWKVSTSLSMEKIWLHRIKSMGRRSLMQFKPILRKLFVMWYPVWEMNIESNGKYLWILLFSSHLKRIVIHCYCISENCIVHSLSLHPGKVMHWHINSLTFTLLIGIIRHFILRWYL